MFIVVGIVAYYMVLYSVLAGVYVADKIIRFSINKMI